MVAVGVKWYTYFNVVLVADVDVLDYSLECSFGLAASPNQSQCREGGGVYDSRFAFSFRFVRTRV